MFHYRLFGLLVICMSCLILYIKHFEPLTKSDVHKAGQTGTLNFEHLNL